MDRRGVATAVLKRGLGLDLEKMLHERARVTSKGRDVYQVMMRFS